MKRILPVSPRLAFYDDELAGRWWHCWSPDCELQGYGVTPKDAYDQWVEYSGNEPYKGKSMNDKHKRIEAMYHLETLMQGSEVPADVLYKRITAAHYLVQSMLNGPKPENYDEVMREVNEMDAQAETIDVMRRIKVQR